MASNSMARPAKRRVLHIINDLPYWLMHREPIAAAAKDAGFHVAVASANHEIRKAVVSRGYDFHPLPVDRFSLGPNDLRLVFAIRRLLKAEVPDVVHLFTIKPLLLGGLAVRSLPPGERPRVIGTIAGLGRGFDLPPAKRTLLIGGLKAGLGHVASVLTFENPDDAQAYVTAGIVPASRVEVFNGAGIDLDRYRPALHPAPDRPLTFLFASRLLRSKGALVFAEAARRLKGIHGPRVHFRMAGLEAAGEPDAVSPGELAAIKADPAIEWLGAVGHEQMPRIMQETDVFVLPTSYPEGLPRSCLEAGACGAAIIAGDVPGTRFLIEHDQDGILLTDTGPEAVSGAMERMFDQGERNRLVAAMRQKIIEGGFGIDAISARFLGLYA